jgi:hypothetical protein
MASIVNITLTLGHAFAWQIAKFESDPAGRAAIMTLFWSSVKRDDHGCWLFEDSDPSVYASAAAFAWLASRGPAPEGSVLNRSCRHEACVNPSHLFLTAGK